MGKDAFYLDEYLNRQAITKSTKQCYLVANKILLEQIEKHKGKLKVGFSISGITIEQFRTYAPEVLESFKELAATGCVDFLAETYSHSLASLTNKEEFYDQVKQHCALITKEFGVKPKSFCNTEMIYSDGIGQMVNDMGFHTLITEGVRHVLGWKSPNYVYANGIEPKLKLLIRNSSICDDIRYRYNDTTWDQWPLGSERYAKWIAEGEGDVTNIYLDYETFGVHNSEETGIFSFLENLPAALIKEGLEFCFAHEATKKFQPISALNVPYPISWADEEKDTTSWLGNELQREAFSQLYSVRDKIKELKDENLTYVWDFLQCSNHLYFMSTKWFIGKSIANTNPYDSPYEAFMNYMNVVSDFLRQVREK